MTFVDGFEIVRRQRRHDQFQNRDLIASVSDILGGLTDTSTSPTSSADDGNSDTSSTAAASPSPTDVGSSGGSSGGSSNTGSSGGVGSSNGSSSKDSSGGNGGNAGGSNAGAGSSASPISNAASAAATSNRGGSNNAAAPTTPSTGSSATAAAAAVTPAAVASTSTPPVALTTSLITAANGSVATSILPIGGNPTANPFGNVALINSSSAAIVPVSSIIVPPGGYGSSTSSDSGSGSSKNEKIIIPVAVIAGVLALGLLIALMLQKQRNSMERELRRPNMMSNKANLIAATTGALGFTAAGVFRKNRRGSEYNQSSHGHGGGNYGDAGDRESWLAGRPISEAIDAGAIQYEDRDSMDYSNGGHLQTTEMSNEELAAASSGAILRPESVYNGADQYQHNGVGMAMSSNNHNNNGPMDHDSNHSHRQSVITGEGGGYLTASEEGNPMHGSFFNHNNNNNDNIPRGDVADAASSQSHYDGSADYGYSNSAAKGLDAAAVQKASGGQMLSPYKDVQRGNDGRHSFANTEVSVGQAYDGVDMDEDPFNLSSALDEDARPNPHYDGNRIMQHPQLNSSRWSG